MIATGSRTAIPPIEGIEDVEWVDHISALEVTELPESLLVVGGGAVGLEFGQAFSRFGSRVTMVDAMEHRRAVRSDAAAELEAARTEEGIELVTNTFVSSVRQEGGEVEAVLAPRDAARSALSASVPSSSLPDAPRTSRSSASNRSGSRRRRSGSPSTSTCARRGRDLGRGRRNRGRPVHSGRPVPGAGRDRGHVRRRRDSRLLHPADRGLHRSGARAAGADRERGPRARLRRRKPSATSSGTSRERRTRTRSTGSSSSSTTGRRGACSESTSSRGAAATSSRVSRSR